MSLRLQLCLPQPESQPSTRGVGFGSLPGPCMEVARVGALCMAGRRGCSRGGLQALLRPRGWGASNHTLAPLPADAMLVTELP